MRLLQGDCLDVLKTLPDCSVDAVVTDPPAGIAFMGKSWDTDKGGRDNWVTWMTQVAAECLRVLNPGGHALVWALPRTSHWTATAWENAGFEVRDVIHYIFGSGFPKSLDIGKAIDREAGAEREVIGRGGHCGLHHKGGVNNFTDDGWKSENRDGDYSLLTAPATPAAAKWDGWGTALKPAAEHWLLLRKPLSEKTVAQNVLKWGTGGVNVDACRIPTSDNLAGGTFGGVFSASRNPDGTLCKAIGSGDKGRFPANLIHDGSPVVVSVFPQTKSGAIKPHHKSKGLASASHDGWKRPWHENAKAGGWETQASEGSAARFFYCAKASRADRDEDNNHPTVKPSALMRYLCKLITPPGGVILDPFMGSGSTGKAAMLEEFDFIGIELDAEYYSIAERRISAAKMPLFAEVTA